MLNGKPFSCVEKHCYILKNSPLTVLPSPSPTISMNPRHLQILHRKSSALGLKHQISDV